METPTDPNDESLAKLDKAREYFKKMKGTDFDAESGIDYMDDTIDEADVLQDLDSRLELVVQRDMERAIDKVTGSNTTLRAMVKGLQPFLDRKELGTKDAEATRTFVIDHLRNQVMPTLPKGKQILLNSALERFA